MITGIVLSGGSSRRMGKDKALLFFEEQCLISHVVSALEGVCRQILVVAQPQQDLSFLGKTVVHDIIPGYGALMGLYTGLKNAPTDRILAVACDMPFLQPKLLEYLIHVDVEADVVVPRIDEHLEPLLAVYSRNCLGPIEDMINRSQKCVYDLYPNVRVREISQKELRIFDSELKSFINFNTPQELFACSKQYQRGEKKLELIKNQVNVLTA
jgi:molybdopterin-guanine dinucleotide biosynthesis protein A